MEITSLQKAIFRIHLHQHLKERGLTCAELESHTITTIPATAPEEATAIKKALSGEEISAGAIKTIAATLELGVGWLLGCDETYFATATNSLDTRYVKTDWVTIIQNWIDASSTTKEYMMALYGSKLTKALKEKGWDKTKLRYELIHFSAGQNINMSSINKYLRSAELPNKERITLIAALLNKHPLWFLGGKEEAWPNRDLARTFYSTSVLNSILPINTEKKEASPMSATTSTAPALSSTIRSERLREAMCIRMISQSALAPMAKTTQTYVSELSRGKGNRYIKPEILSKLATALNMNELWLQGADDVPFERDACQDEPNYALYEQATLHWATDICAAAKSTSNRVSFCYDNFAKHLASQMRNINVTQAELVTALEQNNPYLQNAEEVVTKALAGTGVPDVPTILYIARLLNCSPYWLVSASYYQKTLPSNCPFPKITYELGQTNEAEQPVTAEPDNAIADNPPVPDEEFFDDGETNWDGTFEEDKPESEPAVESGNEAPDQSTTNTPPGENIIEQECLQMESELCSDEVCELTEEERAEEINRILSGATDMSGYALHLVSEEDLAILTAFKTCAKRSKNLVRHVLGLNSTCRTRTQTEEPSSTEEASFVPSSKANQGPWFCDF